MSARPPAPAGYERFDAGRAEVVALHAAVEAVREALRAGSLYAYAQAHPDARPLVGRATAYAVPLPAGGGRVVVRHSRHGGLLAPLTGDRFLAPTRAPAELEASLRLTSAGVPTPALVAYALYPAGPLLRRADVVTREVADARDLAAALAATTDPAERRRALAATARLLRQLGASGARHPDLNARNVLLAGDGRTALVIDVDRVSFHAPHHPKVAAANLARLTHSLRASRQRLGLAVSDDELRWLDAQANAPVAEREVA